MTVARLKTGIRSTGVLATLCAAALFGASTPLAKHLVGSVNPWLLAGLLYLGSGIGLTLFRLWTRAPSVHLARGETMWLAGAIIAGGMVAPVLLMLGLTGMPASTTSLLLTSEGLFTTLLAWFAFKEKVQQTLLWVTKEGYRSRPPQWK